MWRITASNVNAILCAVVATSLSTMCLAQHRQEREFKPQVVVKHPIRPIVDAPVIAARDVTDEVVTDNELVLGVVVNGQPRAYPINMLTGPSREIINDELGGEAIALTW